MNPGNITLPRVLLIIILCISSSYPALAGQNQPMSPGHWLLIPFLLLLCSIAIIPLISHKWWEKYYPAISVLLGAFMAFYYLFIQGNPARVIETGEEYVSFIVLIVALFIISGGIHIHAGWTGTPVRNTLLLAAGSVLSNIVGTTGAAMLLVRPFIQSNRNRLGVYHIAFFIILVGNIGGLLTPIGDPPLYLGYLRGVPFLWTFNTLWPVWLTAVLSVLLIFYIIDSIRFVKQSRLLRDGWSPDGRLIGVKGIHNIIFVALVVASFFLSRQWYVRAVVMTVAAAVSYFTTSPEIHRMNRFVFAPVREIVILFFGIFFTMIPALDWLVLNAGKFDLHSPGNFFWGTGLLSSVLDNAPTYLGFLNAAVGTFVPVQTAGPGNAVLWLIANMPVHLMAVSTGAVFFGALTYIGNGPNFMIRSIALHSGVPMPSFGGYILKYSVPILLPVLVGVWVGFF